MNIRFGSYGIKSDGVCFTVYEMVIVTGDNTRGRKAKAESIGQEREKILGYYGKLSQSLDALMNKYMSAPDKEGNEFVSMQTLMDRLRQIEALIRSVKEPKPPPPPSEDSDDEADIQQ